MPPQIPKRSSCAIAHSRQSSRTSHWAQILFASLVEPPFSGKNASGSVYAHRARCCQERSSLESNNPQSWFADADGELPSMPSHMANLLGASCAHAENDMTSCKLHTCEKAFVNENTKFTNKLAISSVLHRNFRVLGTLISQFSAGFQRRTLSMNYNLRVYEG